jgi:hypothetical protein
MTDTPVRGVQPPPHRGLHALEPLIGDWDVEPIVAGRSIGIGRARFEWIESGAFLVQRSDAEIPADAPPEWQANSPLPTTCVFGLDDSLGVFTMLYADSRSVSRVYQTTLADGRWTIWRDAPDAAENLPDGTDPADPVGSFPHIPYYAIGCTLGEIAARSKRAHDGWCRR